MSRTIKLKRLLNTGIAEAITHAITHKVRQIPTQEPIATQSRLCIRPVSANRRI